MFGPPAEGSTAKRPFGTAFVNGFDFDIEAAATNIATFAKRLRSHMNEQTGKTFYLSAAPECTWPIAWTKDLFDQVPLDMVFVQFYNQGCNGKSHFVFALIALLSIPVLSGTRLTCQ